MSLNLGSNNIHHKMPPLMNDGRNFASWQPEAFTNNQIQHEFNIKSNWDYRKFLQNNANNIMKYNYNEAVGESGNNPSTLINNQCISNKPFLFESSHDSKRPNYGNENSDLKQYYLTREQLNARMVSPSISTIPTNY